MLPERLDAEMPLFVVSATGKAALLQIIPPVLPVLVVCRVRALERARIRRFFSNRRPFPFRPLVAFCFGGVHKRNGLDDDFFLRIFFQISEWSGC